MEPRRWLLREAGHLIQLLGHADCVDLCAKCLKHCCICAAGTLSQRAVSSRGGPCQRLMSSSTNPLQGTTFSCTAALQDTQASAEGICCRPSSRVVHKSHKTLQCVQGSASVLGPAAQLYPPRRKLTKLCRVLHASRAWHHGLPLPPHVGLPHASLVELIPPGRALVLPAIVPLRLSLPVATLLLPLAIALLATVAALRLAIPLLAAIAALRLAIPLLRLLAISLLLAIASLGSPVAALQYRQHQSWAARQALCCATHEKCYILLLSKTQMPAAVMARSTCGEAAVSASRRDFVIMFVSMSSKQTDMTCDTCPLTGCQGGVQPHELLNMPHPGCAGPLQLDLRQDSWS